MAIGKFVYGDLDPLEVAYEQNRVAEAAASAERQAATNAAIKKQFSTKIAIAKQIVAGPKRVITEAAGRFRNIPGKYWAYGAIGATGLAVGFGLFSGFDDSYNTIEGLPHTGLSGETRKYNTDFGSGYQGLPHYLMGQRIDESLLAYRANIWNVSSARREAEKQIKASETSYQGTLGSLEQSEFEQNIGTVVGINRRNQNLRRLRLDQFVMNVEDADTLILRRKGIWSWAKSAFGVGNIQIRLAGIDAPEVAAHPGDPLAAVRIWQNQPGGEEATEFLKRLTANQENMSLIIDPTRKTYERYLGVLVGPSEQNINLQLLEAGAVTALPFGPSEWDILNRRSAAKVEREAKEARAGIWQYARYQAADIANKAIGRDITYNVLTRMDKMSRNLTLGAYGSFLADFGAQVGELSPYEEAMARRMGRALRKTHGPPPKKNSQRFSGWDDAYNTIEGLAETGISAYARKLNTDFGSGWKGILNWVKKLRPGAFVERFAKQEVAAAGTAKKSSFLRDLIGDIDIHWTNTSSPAHGFSYLGKVSVGKEVPASILAHEIGHARTGFKSKFGNLVSGLGPMAAIGSVMAAGEFDTQDANPWLYALAPVALMAPRLYTEAAASHWGIQTLKKLGYKSMREASRTLGSAFGTYAAATIGMGAGAGLIMAHRQSAIAKGNKPLIDMETMFHAAGIGTALAGGYYMGEIAGSPGKGVAISAGISALAYLPSLFMDEGKTKQIAELAGLSLVGSMGGSALAIASMKGGAFFKTGWKKYYEMMSLAGASKTSIKELFKEQAELLDMSPRDIGLYGATNLQLKTNIQMVKNIISKIPGLSTPGAKKTLDKTGFAIESAVGSPYILETLSKYGSLKKIPQKEFIESVKKDIWGGSLLSMGVGVPAGLLFGFGEAENSQRFSGFDDSYNTIQGLPEKGMASARRKQVTDFGSGFDITKQIAKQLGLSWEKMIESKGFRSSLLKAKELKELGAGAFGEAFLMEGVYRGKKFKFVEKQIREIPLAKSGWSPADLRKSYRREQRALEKLEGLDWFPSMYHSEDATIFMEYMPGKKFAKSFGRKGLATRKQSVEIMKAVNAAAERGVTNLDIHRGNFLVSGKRISWIDFGFAQFSKGPAPFELAGQGIERAAMLGSTTMPYAGHYEGMPGIPAEYIKERAVAELNEARRIFQKKIEVKDWEQLKRIMAQPPTTQSPSYGKINQAINSFSGFDDAANTIEGLSETGMASLRRKRMTDFGSGFLRKIKPLLEQGGEQASRALDFIAKDTGKTLRKAIAINSGERFIKTRLEDDWVDFVKQVRKMYKSGGNPIKFKKAVSEAPPGIAFEKWNEIRGKARFNEKFPKMSGNQEEYVTLVHGTTRKRAQDILRHGPKSLEDQRAVQGLYYHANPKLVELRIGAYARRAQESIGRHHTSSGKFEDPVAIITTIQKKYVRGNPAGSGGGDEWIVPRHYWSKGKHEITQVEKAVQKVKMAEKTKATQRQIFTAANGSSKSHTRPQGRRHMDLSCTPIMR